MSNRLSLRHACLDYPLLTPESQSLRAFAAGSLIGGGVRHDAGATSIRALDDVTLECSLGDRIAIFGGNGAGKSSLLRLLAGVYSPTSGSLEICGSVSTCFDIYQGMNEDDTGEDFILTRALFQGLSPAQVRSRMPEVFELAGIGDYIYRPMRTYSSGMRIRLAFAVATMADPDIFLLDEIFGVGDKQFLDRSTERIMQMASGSSVTLFSTHWIELAEKFCTRAIWLDRGRVRMDDEFERVAAAYREVRTQF